MRSNHGFTLIETIFVLSIICILSLLVMGVHLPKKSELFIIEEIKSFINEAKLNAMVHKETVTLNFNKDKMTYSTLDSEKEFLLSDNSYFDTYELTFNQNGNINGAKTIDFYFEKHKYQFIFQVGSGSYYVQ